MEANLKKIIKKIEDNFKQNKKNGRQPQFFGNPRMKTSKIEDNLKIKK
jgi:hypothetical protein